MHIYGPSQLHGPQAISAPHGARPAQPTTRPEAARLPTKSTSPNRAARRASSAASRHRADRVEAVRQQIAAGTYETGDKLNAAVEHLLDEIG